MNIISLTMFPFLSKALLISTGLMKESAFEKFVIDRKQHISTWVMKTLEQTIYEVCTFAFLLKSIRYLLKKISDTSY